MFDTRGALVARGLKEAGVTHPAPDRVEQDPEALVASVHAAIDDALTALGERRRDVVAAGLATQRSSIVCWDRITGEVLSPVLSWQDRRAHEWLAQFAPQQDDIHRRTGLMLSAHYGASKFRWCLDHLPVVAAAQAAGRLALGPLASFLTYRLVGSHPLLADPANASRTLLWNLDTGAWDPVLCALFGVPEMALPACVPTYHGFGVLRSSDLAIPLSVVTGDQSAALFASGSPRRRTAYVNLGTGAFVQCVAGNTPCNHARLLSSIVLRDAAGPVYVLEGTVNGAGAALAWFAGEHGIAGLESKLEEWLSRDGEPPLFLNGIGGLGAPFWIADLASRFEGAGETWQQAVAVAESIVFLLQANLDEMRPKLSPPARIVVSGGLAANKGLCQRLTDLSGVPVYRPAEHEATACGTAWLLAGKPANWPETAPGTFFNPQLNLPLRGRYRRWRELMGSEVRAESPVGDDVKNF